MFQNIENRLEALTELKTLGQKAEREIFLGYCDRDGGWVTTLTPQLSWAPGLPRLMVTTAFALVWPHGQGRQRQAIDMTLALKAINQNFLIPCQVIVVVCCFL